MNQGELITNLRGRAGRQGDPGSSRFYVSLEDEIMRIFGGDQISKLMTTLKMPEDVPLEHPMVSKAIEQAQVKVESFHFDSRKHLVEYDDVMNKQREVVYKRRRQILEAKTSLKEKLNQVLFDQVDQMVEKNLHPSTKLPDTEAVVGELVTMIPFDPASQKRVLSQVKPILEVDKLKKALEEVVTKTYEQKEKQVGSELMRQLEKLVMLNTIDKLWIDHLDAVDDLREGIGLRGYGQRDPLVEYKSEAFSMFERLMGTIDYEISRRIFRVQITAQPRPMTPVEAEEVKPEAAKPIAQKPEPSQPEGGTSDFAKAFAGAGATRSTSTVSGSTPETKKKENRQK